MRILPLVFLLMIIQTCSSPDGQDDSSPEMVNSLNLDHQAILAEADAMLEEEIVTITDFVAERSAGGLHDYYSEGLYWWPDVDNPGGPYIRRDGRPNPENFRGHKNALARFSELVTTLSAAYAITGDEKYADRAIAHVRAWFVTPETLMNPNLLYGQAIRGITTGRGIGIIDTLRLINVALSVELLRAKGLLKGTDLTATEEWFSQFGTWLTTHPYGEDEKTNNNNHSTWWGAQVAAFARVAKRADLTEIAEAQFREQLPIQIAVDGSQPDELGRTKPFHYINYNLRAWATYAELLSDEKENFWTYETETTLPAFSKETGADKEGSTTGKTVSLADAMAYALPYLNDPAAWPYLTELETEIHPHQNDFLVFAAWGLGDDRYLETWQSLDAGKDDHHANLVIWQKLKAHE
ncbi:alginate lyase family protein [Lewinella sp. 4G2]|uniref:alginate lyase family protein n=1 Tax=Lewinella sp. 4G2 TaxID=1803372 RepID=UPI0007DFE8E7|nr:alginate lyase family protein [Lewinella sp. 4G2]OAV43129.1 hypothetical protein A3850_000850 [Lewinella sp. 4G2]